jgi:hypothetical protein
MGLHGLLQDSFTLSLYFNLYLKQSPNLRLTYFLKTFYHAHNCRTTRNTALSFLYSFILNHVKLCAKFLSEDLKRRDHLERHSNRWKDNVKLKQMLLRMWTGFTCVHDPLTDYSGHSNGFLVSKLADGYFN